MSQIEKIEGDRLENSSPVNNMPVTMILDNLRSAFNVGNIFRLAEAIGIEEIFCCGYTATPPHPKLEKSARGCETRVRHRHAETAVEAITILKEMNYRIYAVEIVKNATPVWDFIPEFPCAFVLGNEALGVSDIALELCDGFVQLPMFGLKNSLNVGNCSAVIAYYTRQKWENLATEKTN